MVDGMTLYSKIIGTGSYLPERRVTNQDLTDQLAAKGIETSDEWIVSRSGISARHFAEPGQNHRIWPSTPPSARSTWPACSPTIST